MVIDAFLRYAFSWAVDTNETTVLVTNALGMATCRRDPEAGLVIHADRGSQFTFRAFSEKVRVPGLAPSIGAVGCPYDNAVVEALWGRMQAELLNRESWKIRIELALAIHDYIELFRNARRRHSALGMLTPDRMRRPLLPQPRSRPTPDLQLHGSGARCIAHALAERG